VTCPNCNQANQDKEFWHCEECRASEDVFEDRRREARKLMEDYQI
jgi:hypothetical protein